MTRLFTGFLNGIIEYLLLFPILLFLGVYLVPQILWPWLLSILLLFFIGLLMKKMIPKRNWMIDVSIVLLIGISSSFIFAENIFLRIFLAIIHTVIVYRGTMYAEQDWRQLLPAPILWTVGFIIYFVGYFFYRYVDPLTPHLTLITVTGAMFVLITIFLSNGEHLRSATLSKDSKPFISRSTKRQNRLFLLITLIFIAGISNFQLIQNILSKTIIAFLNWIFSGSQGADVVEEMPPASTQAPMFPMGDQKEPSAFAKLMEVITEYLMYAVAIMTVIVIVLLLVKKIRLWLKQGFYRLIQFLKRVISPNDSEETSHYLDEKESIFNWEEWKKSNSEKVKRLVTNLLKREPQWESLSRKEKVRHVYRHFVSEHSKNLDYSVSHTPREVLKELKAAMVSLDETQLDTLRSAYEHTRYGEQEVDDQKIKEIYSLINRK